MRSRNLLRTTRGLALLIVTPLAFGCSADESFSPNLDTAAAPFRDLTASFQTDSLSYSLRAGLIGYEVEIGVEYTNLSPATAYFLNCSGGTSLELDKLVDGHWTRVWSPILLACLSPPIVVQPMSTYRSRVGIFGGYPECNCQPKFTTTDLSGTYRIAWGAIYNSFNSATSAYSSLLPAEMRVSNPFVLTAQPR